MKYLLSLSTFSETGQLCVSVSAHRAAIFFWKIHERICYTTFEFKKQKIEHNVQKIISVTICIEHRHFLLLLQDRQIWIKLNAARKIWKELGNRSSDEPVDAKYLHGSNHSGLDHSREKYFSAYFPSLDDDDTSSRAAAHEISNDTTLDRFCAFPLFR